MLNFKVKCGLEAPFGSSSASGSSLKNTTSLERHEGDSAGTPEDEVLRRETLAVSRTRSKGVHEVP